MQHTASTVPEICNCATGLTVLAGLEIGKLSREDDLTAVGRAAWADVEEPVAGADDVGVVFDHDDAVAAGDELAEMEHQAADVGGVQAAGGFVQQIECVLRRGGGQFGSQFGALGFAAGKGGGGLAERDVAKADIPKRIENSVQFLELREEFGRFINAHVQNVGDGAVSKADRLHGGAEATTVAGGAGDDGVRKEVHANVANTSSPAVAAAAFTGIEAEVLRRKSSGAGFTCLCEQPAHLVPESTQGRDTGA